MRRRGPAHTRQEGASASPRRHTWVALEAARSRGRTDLSVGTALELGSRTWRKPRPWSLVFPRPSRVVTQATRVFLHALRMSCKARDSLSSISGVAVLGVRLSHPPAGCKRPGAPTKAFCRGQSRSPSGAAEGHGREPSVPGECRMALGVPGPSSSSPLSPPGPLQGRLVPDVPLRLGSAVVPPCGVGGRSLLRLPLPTTLLPFSGFAPSGCLRFMECAKLWPLDVASLASQEAFQVPAHTLWVSAPPQSELHGV